MLKSWKIENCGPVGAVLLILTTCSSCSFGPNLNFKELEGQGELYAKDSIQSIGQQWDSQIFVKRADPTLAAGGDPSSLFKIFASKLGPIKKIETIHRENFNEFAGISTNRPDYAAIYKCAVECQLAPATVMVGVIHKDSRWSLSAFNVDSKVLENMNQAEKSASKKYVEHLAPEICSNLTVDFLKQNASPKLAAELNDNMQTMAAKAMFLAISKKLGQFKKCDALSARGFQLVQGEYVYTYVAEAEFEHGKATITISTIKHDGEWKLRAFNIQAHS
ncbi:hypothetical protein BH10CYA1_BH10CYA1_55920 [soil metagenome]